MCALECNVQSTKCANDQNPKNMRIHDWVDVNSMPRKIHTQTLHTLCTPDEFRFAKKLPMTTAEWKKFNEWVKIRGTPKRNYGGNNDENNSKSNKSPSMARLKALSVPKMRNEKYEPKTEKLTFEPNIHRRRIPEKRIRQPSDYKVAKTFQHPDIESKFWREFQFPVSHKALAYQPDQRILKLSEPRLSPPNEHCKDIYQAYIDKAHIMSFSQWKKFKAKLPYLASPKKNFLELPKKPPRGKKVPLSELQPRINRLALRPQSFRYEEYYSLPKTEKSTRSPKGFQHWLNNLAKPRNYPPLEEPRQLGIVSETALKARASKRLKCLALPRKKYLSVEERAQTKNKLKKYVEELLMGSDYERCMRLRAKNKKKFNKNKSIESNEDNDVPRATHFSH